MTKAQKWICDYIYTQFMPRSIVISLIGDGDVCITDRQGEQLIFSVNLFGDIMDKETGKIIAVSDVPHDLDELLINPEAEPTSWMSLPF